MKPFRISVSGRLGSPRETATDAYEQHHRGISHRDRELLQLEFRSRGIYEYFGVPAAVHQALLQAPSKGSFFNRVIRGRFCYSLVSNAGVRLPHRSQR